MNSVYDDPRWEKLKAKVYKRYGRRCMATGMTEAQGVTLSVDHIKPISKRPDLAFKFSNLQILAMPVNSMKSNKTETDYRPLATRIKYRTMTTLKWGAILVLSAIIGRFMYIDYHRGPWDTTIAGEVWADVIHYYQEI